MIIISVTIPSVYSIGVFDFVENELSFTGFKQFVPVYCFDWIENRSQMFFEANALLASL